MVISSTSCSRGELERKSKLLIAQFYTPITLQLIIAPEQNQYQKSCNKVHESTVLRFVQPQLILFSIQQDCEKEDYLQNHPSK